MNADAPIAYCRVCGDAGIKPVARFRPYLDYETTIYDCPACGCRFTAHDPHAHELLHVSQSSYATHAQQSDAAASHFAWGAISSLRRFLARTEKQRFVLDFVDAHPELASLAEIGCSRGYLTSYFIAQGREIHGFDISPTAVAEARRKFGDHFHLMDDASLNAQGPYDAIYHLGTIGCVDQPIALTERLLAALKPGGWLLFNAPVREHLEQTGALWPGTPPPDLVTVFPARFWHNHFAAAADVRLDLACCSRFEAWLFRRRARRRFIPTRTIVRTPSDKEPAPHSMRKLAATGLRRSLRWWPSQVPQPYGAYVVMRKHAFPATGSSTAPRSFRPI